jgi:hypothetical protein
MSVQGPNAAGGPPAGGGSATALYAAPFVQNTLPKLETDIKNTEALLEQALQQPNLSKQQKHEVQLALKDIQKIENDFPVARPGGGAPGSPGVPGTPGGPIITLPDGGKVVVAPMAMAGAPPSPIMNPPWGGFSQFQQKISQSLADFRDATGLINTNRGDLNRSGLENPQLNDIAKKIGAAEKALAKIQTFALPAK